MLRNLFKTCTSMVVSVTFLTMILILGPSLNPVKVKAASTSYEAEASGNTLQNSASIVNSAGCSGGKKVGNLGGATNGLVIINNVNVPTSGSYKMTVYYCSGDSTRSFYVTVNNGSYWNLATPATGGWDTVGSVTVTVNLNAGNNTIKFDNGGGYAPDLDRIAIDPASIVNITNGNVRIEYDLNTGLANYYAGGVKKISNFYAGVQLASYITSKNYTTRTSSVSGSETTITLTGSGLPTMKQHFYMVNSNYFNTLVEVNGTNLSTNWIAPIIMDTTGGVDIGSYSDNRALWIPFDNDKWVRYNASSINTSGTSFEAAAFYDNTTRNSLIVGSVVHDTWKTGVYYSGSNNRLDKLNIFGGATDASWTHDVMPHGSVTGNTIYSPKVFIGYFSDWRTGMETYASENASNTPKLGWTGGVPFGWNSWGGCGSLLDITKAVNASNYIKNNLMNNNFINNNTTYINLDSYWDSLTDAQLSTFVTTCHNNGQKAGIYWAPFVYWGSDLSLQVPGSTYKYSDITLKKSDGTSISLDGAYALDPTHPGTQARINNQITYFKNKGFEYIKLDFLTHASIEGGSNRGIHYDTNVKTGIQAYNQGMQYVKNQISGSMFISLSIAPLFPYQYGHARRISCDVYGSVSESEYMLNSLTYGWWVNGILYNYNDPDHMTLYRRNNNTYFTATDAKTRVNGAAIAGTVFLNGDDFGYSGAQSSASNYLTNANINNIAKKGKSFKPIEGNSNGSAVDTFVLNDGGGIYYLAVFNYNTSSSTTKTISLSRAGLSGSTTYTITDLWTNTTSTANGNLTVNLAAGESKILKLN